MPKDWSAQIFHVNFRCGECRRAFEGEPDLIEDDPAQAHQLVLNDRQDVVAAIRIPSDTIQPITDMGGRFKNPAAAWEQRDVMTGATLATWAAWQMTVARAGP